LSDKILRNIASGSTVQYLETDSTQKVESQLHNHMKRLLAVLFVMLLATPAWAEDYSRWTTPALQKTRIELYKTIPTIGNNKGVTVFAKHSQPQPEEVEIQKIEKELKLRQTHGDKGAYFEPAAPQYPRRLKNPAG
jgi:hypothetical protein